MTRRTSIQPRSAKEKDRKVNSRNPFNKTPYSASQFDDSSSVLSPCDPFNSLRLFVVPFFIPWRSVPGLSYRKRRPMRQSKDFAREIISWSGCPLSKLILFSNSDSPELNGSSFAFQEKFSFTRSSPRSEDFIFATKSFFTHSDSHSVGKFWQSVSQ